MQLIKISYISAVFLSLSLFLLPSCTHEHTEGDGHDHGHSHDETDSHSHDEHHDEGIHLTKTQMATMDIQFGDFSAVKINDFISATGTLGLPPNALTSVSAKANGFIKGSNKYIEGNYVKQGVIMAYLENPEFIQHQQAYMEVSAELVFARQELARQQTLNDADAGVEKTLQNIQSEVAIKTAQLSGISKQLAYLGINVEAISPENIVQRIPIYSPMAGYITSIKMHNGMYVTPEMELMEIVNEHHLHLELDVFEQDIANIKTEQKISYVVPAMGTETYAGEVNVIGKEFDTANKTVRIHGHLEKERPPFIKDLFVEAKIWLNDQTVQALPEGAIIKDGAFSYIYVADEKTTREDLKFEKLKVIPGVADKGFVAVKLVDEIPSGLSIITKGAYYVYAQSKAGELEHSH